MKLIGIHTPILHAGDDIGSILRSSQEIEDGDIVIVSSKAIATVENTFIHLEQLSPSDEANEWSTKTGRGAAFCEAVLQEVARLNGKVVGHCPGAMVTEVRPDGLAHGSILTANAGLDESNTAHGTAIGWPRDPVASGAALKQSLQKNVAVIITDSCLRPRRLGVVAFALTVCGLDPIRSERGKADLFGRELRITSEAIADQLSTAANFVMGNANQAMPACIVRDHGLTFSGFNGWVPAIAPEEDLFRGIL